jgi:general stress protein YciG
MIADESNASAPKTETVDTSNEVSTTEATTAAPEQAAAPTEQPRPRRRGFAAMDQTRVKEIASKGGKAAHAAGTAHQFSSDEARNAGRKGGMAPHVRRGGTRRRPESAGATSKVGEQSGDGR